MDLSNLNIQYQAKFEDVFWLHNTSNGNVSLSDMGILLKPGERIKIFFGQVVGSSDFLIQQGRNRVKLYTDIKHAQKEIKRNEDFIIKRKPK